MLIKNELTPKHKHIVCFSGGHSSALVAIEVARKFGIENTILLNHNISSEVELPDIKRFKQDVADYLGLGITYANHANWETLTPIRACLELGIWANPANRQILCTYKLKTKPFYDWLKNNYASGDIIYYGFDGNEAHRITRRSNIMGGAGYKTDYPLALWSKRTIKSTLDVGINSPMTYNCFKHANCVGCLKAGWQHWYVVYCAYPNIFKELVDAEDKIGYSVHKDGFAYDKIELFEMLKTAGVPATEKTPSHIFWATVKNVLKQAESKQLGQVSIFDLPIQEMATECTGDCRLAT